MTVIQPQNCSFFCIHYITISEYSRTVLLDIRITSSSKSINLSIIVSTRCFTFSMAVLVESLPFCGFGSCWWTTVEKFIYDAFWQDVIPCIGAMDLEPMKAASSIICVWRKTWLFTLSIFIAVHISSAFYFQSKRSFVARIYLTFHFLAAFFSGNSYITLNFFFSALIMDWARKKERERTNMVQMQCNLFARCKLAPQLSSWTSMLLMVNAEEKNCIKLMWNTS